MAYIYPQLKPRVTVKPLSKQAFAGGYQNAILAMQKQQMPLGMDPLRWREQQRANARYLGNVFGGGGGGPQAHDRPVNSGGFTPGIDPSAQQWQDEMYGAQPQPLMLQAGPPRPGLGMGAGMGQLGAMGQQPMMPRPALHQRGAIRRRMLPSLLPRPKYTTNV